MRFIEAVKLAYRLYKSNDSAVVSHAKFEMECAWPDRDDMQDLMKANLIELLSVFSSQGHSGFSARYAISSFEKLAMFQTLSPLTGADIEWAEPYCDEGTQQNKRDGRVFRNADGSAYFIDGKIFRDSNGSCFTNINSRVYISDWPYLPVTEYVDLNADKPSS